ncbi:MAG: helix-turn-helix domain-containing protein [Acidimicrobiales bacterium]
MSMKSWEKKVLQAPGAPERVGTIENELRLATGLTALREQAGLSQRALAKLIGVTQPRIAAIERSTNVTVGVLAQYAMAVGGHLEVSVVKGRNKVSLLPSAHQAARAAAKRSARSVVPSAGHSASRTSMPMTATAKATRKRSTALAVTGKTTKSRSPQGRRGAVHPKQSRAPVS